MSYLSFVHELCWNFDLSNDTLSNDTVCYVREFLVRLYMLVSNKAAVLCVSWLQSCSCDVPGIRSLPSLSH